MGVVVGKQKIQRTTTTEIESSGLKVVVQKSQKHRTTTSTLLPKDILSVRVLKKIWTRTHARFFSATISGALFGAKNIEG
jgi:aspartate aminotransferase-like enzyme